MQLPRNVQNLVPFSQTFKQSWPKCVTGASFFVTWLSKYIRLILKINLKLCSSLGMFKVWCPFLKPVNSHLVHLFFCDLPFKVQQIDARDQPKTMQQPRNVENLVPFTQTSKWSWPKSVTDASCFVACTSKYITLMLKINLKLCSSLEMFKIWCPSLKPLNSHGQKV